MDSSSFEKEIDGKPDVRRVFYSTTQIDRAVNSAKNDMANNRVPRGQLQDATFVETYGRQ